MAAGLVAGAGLLAGGRGLDSVDGQASETVVRSQSTPETAREDTAADSATVGSLAAASEEASTFAALLTPAPSPTAGIQQPSKHPVVAGETLVAIADRYGLRPETLVWANNLEDADLIVVGQDLVVPPGDGLLYDVEAGDSLAAIAHRYGVLVGDVASVNAISNPDLLQVGATLFLPGARPLAPAASVLASQPAAPAAVLAAAAAPPESPPLKPELQAVLDATWEKTAGGTQLFSGAGPDARPLGKLPAGARLERTGPLAGRRLPVRDPGDGQTRLAMSGWIEAADLVSSVPPGPRELPRSYPDNARMDIPQVFAPYRTQLDGTAYAAANCGPANLSMALASFGIDASPGGLRPKVLAAQGIWGNDVGSLITALAQVAESYGLQPIALRDDGGELRRWTLEDLRVQLRNKHPLIVQVSYRGLPGREGAAFFGDHYIVLTGLLDDGFLYNDSINHDGLGWDRVISGARLLQTMNANDRRYAYTAFALAR